MNYYHNLNKSFKKLLEGKSFITNKKINEEEQEILFEPIDLKSIYKELLDKILENIKGDWFDAVLVDNVIYVLESDFEFNIGNDETQNIGLGVFAIYEFKGNKVISHLTKLETIEDTHEVGIKPLSYFISKSEPEIYDSISEFIDWYDYYFGRKTFMLDPEFKEYFENIKNELGELLKESANDEIELEKHPPLLVKRGEDYIAQPAFKEIIVSILDDETTATLSLFKKLSKYFFGMDNYIDEDIDFYVDNVDKEWIFKHDDKLNKEETDYTHGLWIGDTRVEWVNEELLKNLLNSNFFFEEETLVENNGDEEDTVDIELFSPDEVKERIDPNTSLYNQFGDDLFIRYKYLLPQNFDDNLSLVKDIKGYYSDLSDGAKNYFKKILLDELSNEGQGIILYRFEDTDFDFDSGEISSKFLRACFNEELFGFFDYSISDVDISYLNQYQYLDEETFKELNKLGFTKEFIVDVTQEEVDEEHPQYGFVEEIQQELKYASVDAYRAGAEDDALDYFNSAFKKAMPKGVTFTREMDNAGNFANITITKEFIEHEIANIYDNWEGYDIFKLNIQAAFLYLFKENFNMYEPRYGFDGFSKSVFNETFRDICIPELEDLVNKSKTENK